jgi:hypothetical protein
MRFLFFKIWSFFIQVFGLILPFFAHASAPKKWGPATRWTVRLLVLTAILVLLWYVNNYWFEPSRWIGGAPSRGVARFWLPILFLLTVCLSWLGHWLWKLLTPEEESSDFPDIDAAWEEARAALESHGIGLTEVPLFFILGRPVAGEQALIQASKVQVMVRQTPASGSAPLHVFANREGIYVTCPGASLMGRQAAILAGDEDVAPGSSPEAEADPADEDWANYSIRITDIMRTQGGRGGAIQEVQEIMLRAQRENRLPTPQERRRIRELSGMSRPSLLRDAEETKRLTARLTHLCRLIVRDRRPYCPVNALLVIVPLAAADTDEDATQTAHILQADLATARKAFQVHCPLIAMVGDLETSSGFREFFERFPERERQRRIGQRFPLVPNLDPAAVPAMAETGVQWICHTLFPTWVYKFFRVEGPGREDMAQQVQCNTQLYRLMHEMRQRNKPLARVLARGILGEPNGPALFGGCYVTATGRDPAREQAFTAGVFRRLIDEQNYVAWTAEALAEDAAYLRWTKIGYLVIGIFAAVVLAVIGYFWYRG